MTFAPGTTFERYTIEAVLGRGGMGEVYLASDPRLRRKVAIKVVRDDENTGEAAARLRREARTAAALSHPNVVAVHDVGEVDGVYFIVMEYVKGESLHARLRRGEPIPLARRLGWLVEVARALASAHGVGVVHRDVKPSNVMISDDGGAKVVDFGLARSLAPASFHTRGDALLGTPTYMAPELAAGAQADAASDQYAFGVTAYEVLSGMRPGARADASPLVSDVAPDVPVAVARAVARTLSWDPEARFRSMAELADLLEVARSGLVASGASAAVEATLPDSTLPVATERDSAREIAAPPNVDTTLPMAGQNATKPLPPMAPRARTAVMPPLAAAPRAAATHERTAPTEPTKKVPRPEPAAPSRAPIVLGLAGVVTVAAAVAIFLSSRGLRELRAPKPEATSAAPSPSTATPVRPLAPDETRWRVPVDGSPTRGPSDAPVTIVAFCEATSPPCKAGDAPLEAVLARHGARVRLVTKALGPDAREADADLADDLRVAGVTGGSATFVNGRRVTPPSIAALSRVVDEELAAARPAPGKDVYAELMARARDPFEAERRTPPAVAPTAPTKGTKGAPVVLQVWADYGAPECQSLSRALTELVATQGPDLEIVWRDRPLATETALAAEAAREALAQKGPPGFWRMNERLLGAPDHFARAELVAHARALGLDVPAFEGALDRGVHRAAVEVDVTSARASDVAGTPAFLVNGYLLVGPQPVRRLRRVVRRALDETKSR